MPKPRCRKCNRDHYNYKPCLSTEPGLYGWGGGEIEWREESGLTQWGDRLQEFHEGGWGCEAVLPKENR